MGHPYSSKEHVYSILIIFLLYIGHPDPPIGTPDMELLVLTADSSAALFEGLKG